MILCIGTTPAAQRVMVFRKLVPDAVNRAATTLDGAAGKSINVAKVLHTLGAAPVAAGFLGGDRGQELLALLQANGLDCDFVSVAARTRQCITVIDQATGNITELVEESRAVTNRDYEQLEATVRRRLPGCRALVMSGSLTPGGPVDFYARLARLAHEAAALPIVDAQGPPLAEALKAKPAVVKPNRAELAATVGRELHSESEFTAAMSELHKLGAQRVVVTAGQEPTLAFDGERFWRIRPPRITALNPIGSGDAFTAGLVWRLVKGEPFSEACRWGAAAGAANALQLMAGEVDPAEVERLAREVVVEPLP